MIEVVGPPKNEGILTVSMTNGPKMFQTSIGAFISSLISFTVDDVFWGDLFISAKGFFMMGSHKWNRVSIFLKSNIKGFNVCRILINWETNSLNLKIDMKIVSLIQYFLSIY